MADKQDGFEITIKGKKEMITLVKSTVTSVKFEVKTYEENVKDRSRNIVNVVTIEGAFNDVDCKEVRKLAVWSLATDKEEVYREVTIKCSPENSFIRQYSLNNAFCISYEETFDSNMNTFKLIISQKKDNLDGIKINA